MCSYILCQDGGRWSEGKERTFVFWLSRVWLKHCKIIMTLIKPARDLRQFGSNVSLFTLSPLWDGILDLEVNTGYLLPEAACQEFFFYKLR